jgi:transitional endoplasmic reticulum ATPase
MSADYGLNLTSFPGASTLPLSPSELVTNVLFVPIARRLGSVPGILLDNVVFGGFKVAWNVSSFCSFRLEYCIEPGCNQTYDFIIYTARVLLLLYVIRR